MEAAHDETRDVVSELPNLSLNRSTSTSSTSSSSTTSSTSSSPSSRGLRDFSLGRRHSRFKHIYGTVLKKELSWTHLRTSTHMVHSNAIRTNGKFFAVPGQASGGGPIMVVSVDKIGRIATNHPLLSVHTAPITDMNFSPFDLHSLASGAEDGQIVIWRLPEAGFENTLSSAPISAASSAKTTSAYSASVQGVEVPHVKLAGGHGGQKVYTVNWSSVANNVLASTGQDGAVKIWDVERSVAQITLSEVHSEPVTQCTFDYQGANLVTSSRDKKMRLIDPRAGSVVQVLDVPEDRCQCLPLGNSTRAVSIGFNGLKRQLSVLDWRVGVAPLVTREIDASPSTFLPYFDEDTQLLYLAGKGDSSIKVIELFEDAPHNESLPDLVTSTPQLGLAPLPKNMCNVRDVELARFLKLTANSVEQIKFQIPRARPEFFQDDLYPPTRSTEPVCSGEQWFAGEERSDHRSDGDQIARSRSQSAASVTSVHSASSALESSASEVDSFGPKLVSLQPEGMVKLSEAPQVERRESKSLHYLKQKEEEEAKLKEKENHVQRMTSLALAQVPEGAKYRNRWDAYSNDNNSEDEWDDS